MSSEPFNWTQPHEDLLAHVSTTGKSHLRDLLNNPARFHDLSYIFEDILFDFSKQRIDKETISLLGRLADARNLEEWRTRLFAGEKINTSEGRAVQHMALRTPEDKEVLIAGNNVVPAVHQELRHMKSFAQKIRDAHVITHVVNIGIGGSDLGPRFVTEALRPYHDGPEIRFVSNVDGQDLSNALESLNPKTTLFIIASKTFTTQETMLNANSAKTWFLNQGMKQDDIKNHFVALSTNAEKVSDFGIDPKNIFKFEDWVGGRYSVWSPIGLSVMLAIGPEKFQEFLDGAHAADIHFQTMPLEKNIPVLLGMIGIWNRNYLNLKTHLFAPYDTRLAKFAKFIQQMDMESNGKSVDRDGRRVDYETGPQVYGETGTDSQHSYMQLVHQGTDIIPIDFIACARPHHELNTAHHIALISNMQAQSRALARGQTAEEAGGDASRVYEGNRPSTTILLPELTPRALGTLIALYEHKVFVQGIIWNLNSYDQPGVELGKVAANALIEAYTSNKIPENLDSSTKGQMAYLQPFIYRPG
ncbi:MAG: glucose-6-phosphate isomerase [Micavibrio aeruginosavorus]|uniref:Glucose-6-phosphate isomerase n=1 Tax=Micavibrio aeruginosavorus TaxID=349221 RepID=A0A2W5HTM2_9BACT|nr:MAG: glucose-6-phosphate isomerase [Micavibrio aeruginosavorus]